MKIKIFAWLFISLFIVSCNSSETSETTEDTATEEKIEAMPLDATTWEGFWNLFQDAATHKDKETMQALCHFNELFPENILESDFDIFFGDAMLNLIKQSTANSFPVQDNISEEFTEVRSLQLIDNGKDEETGETYESALIMLFGKKDGEFGIIRMAMAG